MSEWILFLQVWSAVFVGFFVAIAFVYWWESRRRKGEKTYSIEMYKSTDPKDWRIIRPDGTEVHEDKFYMLYELQGLYKNRR